jgi:HIRAN domain
MVLMATEKRQVNIVGSSFHPGASNWIAKMAPGQQLRVEREPKNKYDANAVAVYIFQQHLGYFPRGFAAEVAPLMDAGYELRAIKSRDPRFAGTGVMVVEWEKPDVQQGADAGEDQ